MEWNQTYGGTNHDWVSALVQTNDGGYALAGVTLSFGGYDFWLVKTDASGTMQWNMTYGGTNRWSEASALVQTNDGGYALAGLTLPFLTIDFDFWLVKTNSTGGMEWNQTYGGLGDDYARSVVQTSDGGYALAGYTNSFGAGGSDFYLVKARSCTLTITTTTGGTTSPSPGAYSYSVGTVAAVTALPNANYAFDHWSLDGAPAGTANTINVTMNADHSLQAVFTRTYTLNITATAGGTTNPAPGTYIYFQGTLVNVTASPDTGYYLDHWELDGANVGAPNPIQVNMNTDHQLKAVFVLLRYTLVITATAGGTTNPAPGTHIYVYGTMVNITASPDTGYYLDHWELDGANVGGANPIHITVNNDHTLHAVFEYGPSPTYYTLNITVTAGGTTNPTPGTYIYSDGTLVNISALPNAGYGLDYWSLDGVPAGTTNPTQVTMNTNHELEAAFDLLESLNITATAGGTTNPAPGTYIYFQGTLVNVTASPDTGYYLDHWELDGANVGAPNPISVAMNMNHTLHAIFLAHDVAVIFVESPKTVVGQDYFGNLTVTVWNEGDFTESFNVTVYANSTSIGNLAFALKSGRFATRWLLWNTTGFAKGNYTIWAYAWPVSGETNTANNNSTGGLVAVSIVGDLTGQSGWPDGKVDMRDVGLLARNFGLNVPPAPPNCDITGPTTGLPDGNIDMRDVGTVARNFGKTDP
jgi:hypothetical protein